MFGLFKDSTVKDVEQKIRKKAADTFETERNIHLSVYMELWKRSEESVSVGENLIADLEKKLEDAKLQLWSDRKAVKHYNKIVEGIVKLEL